jgi:serine/threonine-protein kinase
MGDDEDQKPREDRTIFIPGGGSQLSVPGSQPAAPVGSAPPSATGWGSATPFTPELGEGRRIQIGDVLNHIFEVRRFIARGGMGEVFEGVNVNTEERLAIKVILPHLAADPAVQAMFRKEARTLTRLSHPGLVQYRVLAQEPQLRVLYIVTDYIDGLNLSDQLGTLDATPAQLISLLKKLAEGLNAAHALGAIHRDISPDNIILEGGKIERAKIIDFGIAKDLDAAGSTIVGDGFAGKLNYVAPEQLGDFDRQVGPWSDVYSLGLTMMAVVLGRDVNMGATLVDAVDKRRAGLDVSCAPEEMRGVLELMLKANPAERLRSMDDVLRMIEPPTQTLLNVPLHDAAPNASLPALHPQSGGLSLRLVALLGGGLALAVAAVLAVTLIPDGTDRTLVADVPGAGAESAPVEPPADPLGTAKEVVTAEMKKAPCSWFDIHEISADGVQISLSLRGVSGESASALRLIQDALERKGLQAPSIEMSDVSPISANMCRPVEAFNQIRADGVARLTVAQRKFEMNFLPSRPDQDSRQLGAEVVFNLNLAGFGEDMTLVGLDEAGKMSQVGANRKEIEGYLEKLPNDSYRFRFDTTHSGWSGILMLTGKAPFNADLDNDSRGRGADWSDKFLKLARERGWKAEMVWYRTVDELPNKL